MVPGTKMIKWKLRCLDCDYTFRAKTPQALYDSTNRCLMCGSRKIEKKIKGD